MSVCGCERGRGRDCEWERGFDWEWRRLDVSSMSSESWGIVGIVRKSKEFRLVQLGMLSGPWSKSRPDFGVVTCGVYCGWLSFRRERREMSESRVDREVRVFD